MSHIRFENALSQNELLLNSRKAKILVFGYYGDHFRVTAEICQGRRRGSLLDKEEQCARE